MSWNSRSEIKLSILFWIFYYFENYLRIAATHLRNDVVESVRSNISTIFLITEQFSPVIFICIKYISFVSDLIILQKNNEKRNSTKCHLFKFYWKDTYVCMTTADAQDNFMPAIMIFTIKTIENQIHLWKTINNCGR